jgi:EmrB/QacA subfamily drug resistance transporter
MQSGATDPAAAARSRTGAWVLTAAILGSSMVFIDGTVVNVALAAIQRDLGTDAAGVQWVIEAYALTLSALLLVGGALGDRLGRRRVFAAGVALFALSSAACAAAPSIGVLVAARAAQGAAGALLTPGSLALISASFPPPRRGRAIGTWSGFTGITSAAGPLLGGFLVGHASWRWVFLINLPVAAIVLGITARHVPESRDERMHGRLDWLGAILVTAALGLLVLALIRAQSAGMGAAEVLLTGGAALVLLVIFLVVEGRFAEAPMLPLDLFRSRPFSVTNLLTLFLYAALGGALVYLPLTLIEVHGYSPLAAGAALLPFIVVLSVLARFSGGLVDRVGARLPLTVGPLVAAGGFLLLAVPDRDGSYWTTFFPGMVVLGLGMALVVAPLTTTVLSAVATRHAGTASGVNNAVSRTGGLLAVAIFGVVLVHTFDSALDRNLQSIPLTAAQHAQLDAQRSRLALAAAPDGLDATTAAAVDDAVASAFVSGFRAVLISAAALAAASALTAAVGLPARRRPVPAATRSEGVRAEAPA